MERSRTLAVVVLTIIAGCGGFPAGGDDIDTPTITPAPVPETESPLSEGIDTDGVDGRTIVDTHRTALDGESYTLVETLRVGPSDDPHFLQSTQVLMGPNGSSLYVDANLTVSRSEPRDERTEIWWNGERALYRYSFGADWERFYSDDERPSNYLRIQGRFEDLLGSLDVSRVENNPDHSMIIAGSVDDRLAVPRTRHVTDVENATMSIHIDADGVVDRLAVGYDASYHDDNRHRVRYSFQVSAVSSTVPTRPPWTQRFNGSVDE